MEGKRLTVLLAVFAAGLFLQFPDRIRAEERLTVAVAANFAPAVEKIGSLFTGETGIPVQVTVSSSGRLYAQIVHGAPFDLFLSADRRRPLLLFEEGKCDEPLEYARGEVILWSRNADMCKKAESWQSAVAMPDLGKIGMANPDLAPYGFAAKKALEQEGLLQGMEGRLVYGANVAQSFQYAATGATGASFVAASLARTPAGEPGCYLAVPEAGSVVQDACIVRNTGNRRAAEIFLTFMRSERIRLLLQRSGYLNPEP